MKSNTLRILIVVTLIVALAIIIGAKDKPAGKQPPAVGAITGTPQTSAAKLPKMLELGSTTCTPCKAMEKVMDELRESYPDTLLVEFVNVEKSPDVAAKYKIDLIPTQVFLDLDGKEFYRHVGFFPKDDIVAVFEGKGFKLSK